MITSLYTSNNFHRHHQVIICLNKTSKRNCFQELFGFDQVSAQSWLLVSSRISPKFAARTAVAGSVPGAPFGVQFWFSVRIQKKIAERSKKTKNWSKLFINTVALINSTQKLEFRLAVRELEQSSYVNAQAFTVRQSRCQTVRDCQCNAGRSPALRCSSVVRSLCHPLSVHIGPGESRPIYNRTSGGSE